MEGDLRIRVIEAIKYLGMSQTTLSKETSLPLTTLALWMAGKLRGNNSKLEIELEKWVTKQQIPRFRDFYPIRSEISQFHRITKHTNKIEDEISELVPMRIDIEIEGRRLREFITWESQEPHFTPHSFAEVLCEEQKLPPPFVKEITRTIEQKLSRYEKYYPGNYECLQVMEIEVRVDNLVLRDRFVWDINNLDNSPEIFAQMLCSDLGLGGDVAASVSNAIREKICFYQKQQQKVMTLPEPLQEIYRQYPEEWEPKLRIMNMEF
jgi:SNF5 / SMARCB1 / INI1